jgi:hypothetical protein
VLLVESEHGEVVPPPAVASYRAAFGKACSLTYRVIGGADHGLSEERWQRAYTTLLVHRVTEMVLGAREGGGAQRSGGPPDEGRPSAMVAGVPTKASPA